MDPKCMTSALRRDREERDPERGSNVKTKARIGVDATTVQGTTSISLKGFRESVALETPGFWRENK